MEIEKVRLSNLSKLIASNFNGNKAAFARAIDKQPEYVSRWYAKSEKNKRNISGDSARLIEDKCGKNRGWLDGDDQYKDTEDPQTYISKVLEVESRYSASLTFKIDKAVNFEVEDCSIRTQEIIGQVIALESNNLLSDPVKSALEAVISIINSNLTAPNGDLSGKNKL